MLDGRDRLRADVEALPIVREVFRAVPLLGFGVGGEVVGQDVIDREQEVDALGLGFGERVFRHFDLVLFDEALAGLDAERALEGVGHAAHDDQRVDLVEQALESPEKPFVAIIGGSKISGKIDVIQNLIDKVDALAIVGGMVYTFLRAKGVKTGKSLVEEDRIEMAKDALAKAKARGVKLMLPADNILADKFAADAKTQEWDCAKDFPEDWMGLDIGPKSIAEIEDVIETAKTIVWNGPAGVFEFPRFAVGTNAIAKAVAANRTATSIIGGGDSVSAINQAGVADQITHISTGGGASLEFLEGKKLPGVEALTEK